MKTLLDIKQDFEKYFNTDYPSDADDSVRNAEIRNDLKQFILSKSNTKSSVLEAIHFLIDNTGCQEDFSIYQEIRLDLLSAGVISKNILDEMEKLMPIKRW